MKLRIAFYTPIIFGVFYSITACRTEPDFPNTPRIEFVDSYFRKTNVGGQDTLITIISFKDGDGDLGLNSSDTCWPFSRFECDYCPSTPETPCDTFAANPNYLNYIMDMYYKRGNADYVKLVFTDLLTLGGRFPHIEEGKRGKSLEGNIKYRSALFFDRMLKPNDSVYVEITIKDRALNTSNTVKSKPILYP